MTLQHQTIVDVSLELDTNSYAMRTPTDFKKDVLFEMEVLKDRFGGGIS